LLVGNEPHFLGDLAKLLARLPILLFEQHFELIITDKPEVNEDLSNATYCHDYS
jgi:hypothetical protein